MTEEEFIQAINEIAEDICDNANGPIDLSLIHTLKTTPPQNFRDIDIKTREDIVAHIGAIYHACNGKYYWTPQMGRSFNYRNYNVGQYSNWPQYVNHPVLGELRVNRASEMTVRRLGCHAFYAIDGIAIPLWLDRMLRFHKKKHDAIIASILKKYTEEDLACEFGPTSGDYIDFWGISTRKRIMAQFAQFAQFAQRDQHQAEATNALHQLSADIVAFFERSPFKPKYGTETNCADVSICARPE